jgi:general secretion pathway protein D
MKKYFVLIILLTSIGWAKICNSKLFTFSVPDDEKVSLISILKEVSVNSCHINIVYDDLMTKSKLEKIKIGGISVKNYSFLQILNLLVANNNFFYTIKNNILHISYIKTKTFNVDYIPSTRSGSSNFAASSSGSSDSSSSSGSSGLSDTNSVNSEYKFDFWSNLAGNLNNILNSDSEYKAPLPIIDKNAGLVTVTATKKQLSKIENYINQLNARLHKQIMIDVRIYEVHLSKSHKTGIDWSNLSISLSPQSTPLHAANIFGSSSIFSKSVFNAAGLLSFLATQGNVNSVSNPKIVALNNQKAIISVGDTINYNALTKASYTDKNGNTQPAEYSNKSEFIGILLDITPEISEYADIILRINPTVSSFRDETQLNNPNRKDLPPDTSENKLSTVVRIKDGDTLVLGGLITNQNSFKENGVPILKEIPVVKYLFSSKAKVSDKVELVFVVTPHIVREKKKITIKDLGF